MSYKCPDCGKINVGMYCVSCCRSLSRECAVDNGAALSEKAPEEKKFDILKIKVYYFLNSELHPGHGTLEVHDTYLDLRKEDGTFRTFKYGSLDCGIAYFEKTNKGEGRIDVKGFKSSRFTDSFYVDKKDISLAKQITNEINQRCVKANRKNKIKAIITWSLFLSILFFIVASTSPSGGNRRTYESGAEKGTVVCGSCGRTFDGSSSSGKSVKRNGMCSTCYKNYKSAREALDWFD